MPISNDIIATTNTRLIPIMNILQSKLIKKIAEGT